MTETGLVFRAGWRKLYTVGVQAIDTATGASCAPRSVLPSPSLGRTDGPDRMLGGRSRLGVWYA